MNASKCISETILEKKCFEEEVAAHNRLCVSVCVWKRERTYAGMMTVLHSNTQAADLIKSHLSQWKEP